MQFVVNTLYAILTWIAAITIGTELGWGWLAWALVVMAVLQSWATLYSAIRRL